MHVLRAELSFPEKLMRGEIRAWPWDHLRRTIMRRWLAGNVRGRSREIKAGGEFIVRADDDGILTMYGLVSALFAASAALAAPVVTPDTNTCTAKSLKVTSFLVKDFDFHASWTFTTPAHQNSWGYVNFTLANAAVPYEYQCSSASNWLSDFYYGNINYNCTDPAGQPTQHGTFSYSRPTETLAINQTWICAQEQSRFWAEGSAKLDLKCQDTTYHNPNWTTPGQIYSDRRVTCDKLTQVVPLTSLRAAA
ncbi:hypothetical protein CCM_04656 [Cordyceps militaris CM01]|uniref:AA1-like domain-containing protein n=1 Tax=Cordyceps militaris (strain CM01) TaxID=983644 RepID=G3JGL4_CORMM|nr:uncharacterized protein CCM_04656 [Cordyceps militaris CM01]EGX93283.1 hypothetical protein CCM_04656 [Cordyceps militaris CM01]